MQVEGQHEGSLLPLMATGARVSNAYPTCHILGDSPVKTGLTPDGVLSGHLTRTKALRYVMGMRPISLLAG